MPMRLPLLVVATFVGIFPGWVEAANCPIPGFNFAAFGDNGISVQNGNTDSWDSTLGPYATSTCTSLPPCVGSVATNNPASGGISLGPNGSISGQCQIGAGGVTGNITPNNSNCSSLGVESGALSLPVPSLPGSLTGALGVITNNATIATAGSYSMTSLSLSGNKALVVTAGPVVVYLTGSGNVMSLSGNAAIVNSTLDPTKLIFMCTSSAPQTISVVGNGSAYYAIYCPKADVTITGNGAIFGAVVAKSVSWSGNNGFIHYDKALSNVTTSQLACTTNEVSRATPIVATIAGQSHVVQGTFVPTTGTAKTILTTTDVASFEFPYIEGHMRARVASTVTTTSSTFSSGTITLDAANGIPTVTTSGCGLGTNSSFSASCRNVFTNINTPSNGLTTFGGAPSSRLTLFKDSNATAIGQRIAPAGTGANQVPNITNTEWQTIVRRVLKGKTNGTVSTLGGVDRSTVAMIGPSSVAGVNTRPTMIYFGGADGMLHAVCAGTGGTTASQSNICPTTMPDGSSPPNGVVPGTELWAFIPRVQLPLIRVNKQRIDGSVRVVDAFGAFPDPSTGATTTERSFRTILTFQTGYVDTALGGGAAVYALDVTDPAKPILLWEYTTPSTTGAQLGAGLAMHAGPTVVKGAIVNLAVAATNNGGSGGAGFVVNGLSLETGAPIWSSPFSYLYAGPRPSNSTYDGQIPTTGIPAGGVGVDLTGGGFTTDIVAGDLYGNLWRLAASTGANTTANNRPLFSFNTDRHPIGGLPAILDNGSKVAVFASGAYADPSGAAMWTTTGQRLMGVKLSGTTSLTESSPGLAFNSPLTNVNEKVASQVLVVGTEIFITTDTADINASGYGTTGATTGSAYSFNFGSQTPSITFISTVRGGASSLAFNSSNQTMVAGTADQTQRLVNLASTTGTTVDYMKQNKLTRLIWLGR